MFERLSKVMMMMLTIMMLLLLMMTMMMMMVMTRMRIVVVVMMIRMGTGEKPRTLTRGSGNICESWGQLEILAERLVSINRGG